jgi:hypothetical protein
MRQVNIDPTGYSNFMEMFLDSCTPEFCNDFISDTILFSEFSDEGVLARFPRGLLSQVYRAMGYKVHYIGGIWVHDGGFDPDTELEITHAYVQELEGIDDDDEENFI